MTSKWIKNGEWIEYAKEFNALCIQLEHRFYGQSQPTEYEYDTNDQHFKSLHVNILNFLLFKFQCYISVNV